jgi:hypothetical protein
MGAPGGKNKVVRLLVTRHEFHRTKHVFTHFISVSHMTRAAIGTARLSGETENWPWAVLVRLLFQPGGLRLNGQFYSLSKILWRPNDHAHRLCQ